jgi:hypothetical protein
MVHNYLASLACLVTSLACHCLASLACLAASLACLAASLACLAASLACLVAPLACLVALLGYCGSFTLAKIVGKIVSNSDSKIEMILSLSCCTNIAVTYWKHTVLLLKERVPYAV